MTKLKTIDLNNIFMNIKYSTTNLPVNIGKPIYYVIDFFHNLYLSVSLVKEIVKSKGIWLESSTDIFAIFSIILYRFKDNCTKYCNGDNKVELVKSVEQTLMYLDQHYSSEFYVSKPKIIEGIDIASKYDFSYDKEGTIKYTCTMTEEEEEAYVTYLREVDTYRTDSWRLFCDSLKESHSWSI